MGLHQKKRNFVEDRRKEKADTSQGTICMIFIFYLSHQDVIDEGVKSVEF